jgi:POT family proton-dependent oligopeptide transporter
MAVSTVDTSRSGFFSLLTQHPIGFWFIFWGEFAERCSYYGMRAILSLYMADQLGLGKQNAGLFMSVFIGACYFLPLVGGFLADNYFGKYNIIVGFSIPYILGHIILGIESKPFLIIALTLLAMGSGVIKPNISTLMGLTYDQKRPGQDLLRTQAFSMFYMSINIGAFISQLSMPPLRDRHGYFVAFLFPAVLMVVAFIFFAAGKRFYAVETISRKPATPEEKALRWEVMGNIGLVFLMVMFFWAVFDQSASTWIFYADVYMKNDFFGFSAEQMQAINPLLIVAFLPLINFAFTTLANYGLKIRATDKILFGFLLTAITMGIMAYCGHLTGSAEKRDKVNPETGAIVLNDDGTPQQVDFLPEERKVSLWYQAIAYFFLTIAEILISVTGLELAFVAAPKTMKSFVTSLWLLTVALANWLINIPLSQFYPKMHPGDYFAMMAGIMIGVAIIFAFIAIRFNRIMAVQKTVEIDQPPLSDADAK